MSALFICVVSFVSTSVIFVTLASKHNWPDVNFFDQIPQQTKLAIFFLRCLCSIPQWLTSFWGLSASCLIWFLFYVWYLPQISMLSEARNIDFSIITTLKKLGKWPLNHHSSTEYPLYSRYLPTKLMQPWVCVSSARSIRDNWSNSNFVFYKRQRYFKQNY